MDILKSASNSFRLIVLFAFSISVWAQDVPNVATGVWDYDEDPYESNCGGAPDSCDLPDSDTVFNSSDPSDYGAITDFFIDDQVPNPGPGPAFPDPTHHKTSNKDYPSSLSNIGQAFISNWGCETFNNVSPKQNLMYGLATSIDDDGVLKIFGSAARESNSGTSYIGIWLLQDDVGCTPEDQGGSGNWFGKHRRGDWLLLSDFTGGGRIGAVFAYQWQDPDGIPENGDECIADHQPIPIGDPLSPTPDPTACDVDEGEPRFTSIDCNIQQPELDALPNSAEVAAGLQLLCATTNSESVGNVQGAWDPTFDQEPPTYFEFALQFPALFATETCLGSFLIETRSSAELNASLHDYVLGDLNNCSEILVEKFTDPSDPSAVFRFEVSQDGTGPNLLDPNDTYDGGPILSTGGDLPPGTTYSVGEVDLPEGWELDDITCDDVENTNNSDPTPTGDSVDITVGFSETIKCDFTNVKPPKLYLVKEVITDNGGTAAPSAWTLSAGSNDVTGAAAPGTLATETAGTYVLAESDVDGYTQTSLSCVDTGTTDTVTLTGGNTIELANGDDVTCTFINNDDPPSLLLRKLVVTDNGGTASPSSWTLYAGTNAVIGSETAVEATDQIGTYNLTESTLANYTNTEVSCDDDGNTNTARGSVTIGLGETITCTFVNDDDAPSLKLRKLVVTDNGGSAVASDWTLSAGSNDVTGSASATEATDQAGTYSLSETTVANYSNTEVYCDDDGGSDTNRNSVTVGLGETITCTFVNDDDPPSLKLRKVVITDNGGTALPSAWTLSAGSNDVTGSSTATEATDQAGSYSLGETTLAGYTNTSVSCDDGDSSTSRVSVDIDIGETITCTFVNDDIPPSLLLRKVVVTDNGGSAVASDWTLSAGANDVTGNSTAVEATTLVGTYSLSETSIANYTNTEVSCDDDGNTNTDRNSVTLALGQTVTCTFVNDDDPPSLLLRKLVVTDNGGTAGPEQWTLYAGSNGVTGSNTAVEATDYAGTYDLSETTVANYSNTEVSCDDGNSSTSRESVEIDIGETITCTFVNDDDPPSLKLVKVVVTDNGGTAAPSAWTLSAGENDVTGSSTPTEATDQAGTYALSETSIAGYTNTEVSCTDDDGANTSRASVTIGIGDDVTCTFVNDDIAPTLTLVKKVVNGNSGTAGASDWTLTAGGTGGFSGPGSPNGGDTEATNGPNNVLANVGYTLSEAGPSGYMAGDWSCTGDGVFAAGVITLKEDEDATCEITNTALPILTVQKANNGSAATFSYFSSGPSGTTVPATFTIAAAGGSATTPDDVVNKLVIPVGGYTIGEDLSGMPGWMLTDLGCTGATSSSPGGTAYEVDFTADFGENIVCTFVNNQAGTATRTQGFWSTHTYLAYAIWTGAPLPEGTSTIPATPVTGTPDAKLCPADGTGQELLMGDGTTADSSEVMGGFWANIAKKTKPKGKNGKRDELDKFRMQMLQQYLAAVLNVYAFGTPIPGTDLATARAAYCGNDIDAIKTQKSLLASYNESGDGVEFTPGASATPRLSREIADIMFWDDAYQKP